MKLQIHRILHAGYIFQFGPSEQLIFDPIVENPFSYNCFAYPQVEFDLQSIQRLKPLAVVISHFHDDHCSLESLWHFDRSTPVYIFCRHPRLFELIEELGFQRVESLELQETIQIGSFKITPWPAAQVDVDSILQVEVNGLNLLNLVDSQMDEPVLKEFIKRGPWDLLLWPFQSMRETEVLDPRRAESFDNLLFHQEATRQILELGPRYVVPSSCQFRMEEGSWYNHFYFATRYQEFETSLKQGLEKRDSSRNPQVTIKRLNPGEGVELTSESIQNIPRLNWVSPIGPQDVDYEMDLTLPIPSTKDLAMKLERLSEERLLRLETYLVDTLPIRYAEIGGAPGLYFNRKIFWELVVHSASGHSRRYLYRIDGDEMVFLKSEPPVKRMHSKEQLNSSVEVREGSYEPINWLTEIPETKLDAALFEGESLNSILIRMNDREFDPKVEARMREVDVLDDPLLRSLYDGRPMHYQEHQLRRLKQKR